MSSTSLGLMSDVCKPINSHHAFFVCVLMSEMSNSKFEKKTKQTNKCKKTNKSIKRNHRKLCCLFCLHIGSFKPFFHSNGFNPRRRALSLNEEMYVQTSKIKCIFHLLFKVLHSFILSLPDMNMLINFTSYTSNISSVQNQVFIPKDLC